MTARKGRVLVVDDEPDLRALLQRYLTEQDFEVRTLPEATQIDRLLEREPFDVLILDIMMRGEDGLSVCQRLRARQETIPIIMLTARGDPLDRILGRELGADEYLAKPFEPRELLACIHALALEEVTLCFEQLRHEAVGAFACAPDSVVYSQRLELFRCLGPTCS
jgi:two-component system, OmpR family, phosphate regulon response regulator OmpR